MQFCEKPFIAINNPNVVVNFAVIFPLKECNSDLGIGAATHFASTKQS